MPNRHTGRYYKFPYRKTLEVHRAGKGRRPGMSNLVSTVQQYESDGSSRGYNTLQTNDDGVARLVIGESPPTSMQRNSKGLTYASSNERRNHDGSLHRISKSARSVPPNNRNTANYYRVRSRSTSPMKHHNTHHVEEEFRFVPPDTNTMSLPRGGFGGHRSGLKDNTNIVFGRARATSEDNSGRPRQGAYRSIREYEEAQRNGTVPGSGLHTISGSENISPHRALIMEGNNYVIQNPKAQHVKMPVQPAWAPDPTTWHMNEQAHRHGGHQNHGLRLVDTGRFPTDIPPMTHAFERESRSRVRKDMPQHPQFLDIPTQQVSNELQVYSPTVANPAHNQPKYRHKTYGKGENFLKNEAMEYDDDHKYFRQHGQRLKKTRDGQQQLFLDKRLAETNDVIGNQLVQGKHSQKVHKGETVGANHRSQFHSEVRVSQKTSTPANQKMLGGKKGHLAAMPPNQQAMVPHDPIHRKNSRPVHVTTHQWPPAAHFDGPTLHFNQNMPGFQSSDPLQRFFRPNYDPGADMRLNPGFNRFFESIDDFGPQSKQGQLTHVPSKDMKPNALAAKSPSQPYVSENESDASSIRSSASAYWPPELKFASAADESDAVSWVHKPVMKLRRVSPPGHRLERYK